MSNRRKRRPPTKVDSRAKVLFVGADPRSNYIGRVMELSRMVKLSGKAGRALLDVDVRHADDCAGFRTGRCDCDAEVEVVGLDGDGARVQLKMHADGTVEANA